MTDYKRHKSIRWNCKDPKQGCKVENEIPDWAMFKGCFGETGVRPMDIDGAVRQNGKVLFFEKKHPEAVLEKTEIWTIEALVDQGNSYIVFWCTKIDGSDTEAMKIWNVPGYESGLKVAASLKDLRKAVSVWWNLNYCPGKV